MTGKTVFCFAPLVSSLLLLGFGVVANADERNQATKINQQFITSQIYKVNIEQGSLVNTLDYLDKKIGIKVKYDKKELAGLTNTGLQGDFSANGIFEFLKSNTEVDYVIEKGVVFVNRKHSTLGVILPTLTVTEQSYASEVKSLQAIDMRTGVRNDVSEVLSIIPSVRVADKSSSSLQQGNIKPAEFSIRGAAPYQNKLTVDGASIDSFLDPAQVENQSNYTSVAGHSQGLFIDPSFVQEVKVIDVNASAKEGSFTGGVIKTETNSYNGKNTFNVSHRQTRDSWTKFHVDEDQLDEFKDGAAQSPVGIPGEFQPNFKKSTTTASGATRVGDIGIFIGLSEKQSEVQQKQVMNMDLPGFLAGGPLYKSGKERTLDTNSYYTVVRADLLDKDFDLNASLSYSSYKEDSFLINYLDSDFNSANNGINISVNYGDDIGDTRLDLNFNMGLSSNERNFNKNILDQFSYASPFGDGLIGGYGELANMQRTAGVSSNLTKLLTSEVKVSYGGDFKWSSYKQDRNNDFIFNKYNLGWSSGPTPIPGTYYYSKDDHYLERKVVYGEGEIEFNNIDLAGYLELEGEQGSLFWRLGTRLERDGWLENTNIAPRSMVGIYLDDNHNYKVTAGANRYYGKSFLSYKLREKERDYITIQERTGPTDSWNSVDVNSEWEQRELDTPYDNEFSLGVYGPLAKGDAGLQLVSRYGRDQIRTHYDPDLDMRWFDNTGSSKTHQVDLFWRSKSMGFLGANWVINTSLGWMDKETDTQYMGDKGGYGSSDNADEKVIYEGKQIDRNELPASDFAIPVVANIDLITKTFNDQVFVKNSLSYSNGYKYLKSLGADPVTSLQAFEVEKQDSTLRWDLSIEYQIFSSNNSPYIKTDITNVLDRKNVISNESGVQMFGVGRQYWLELGYRY